MSLTTLLADEVARKALEPLLPKKHIRLGMGRATVPFQRNSGGLVGTAFDYVVRFELKRRYPRAKIWPWIAERAVKNIVSDFPSDRAWTYPEEDVGGFYLNERLARRYRQIVAKARGAVDAYVASRNREPSAACGFQKF